MMPFRSLVRVFLVFGLASTMVSAVESVPAWTEAQIEADWRIQLDVSHENLRVLARQDAARVIDGIKDGQPDHQTVIEHWAWWEVDLGSETALDRIEIFNPRPNRDRGVEFKVTVSVVKDDFQQVHYMRGPAWTNGHLVVTLAGRPARWVRVWAGGWRDRLCLSEVEVYGVANPADNIARRGRADQSSFRMHPRFQRQDPVSSGQASAPAGTSAPPAGKGGTDNGKPAAAPAPGQDRPLVYVPVPETIARGQALAAALERQGVSVASTRAALADLARRLSALHPESPVADRIPLYIEARRAVRALVFANPLLDRCDRVLFLKRKPNQMNGMHQQFHGWYSQPGGGVCVMEGLRSGAPKVRALTDSFPPGNFQSLELSYDAKRILFAYARYFPEAARGKKTDKDSLPEESFYHLFELDLGTGAVRQLTHGRYDDLQGSYLPGGDIVFMSSRRGTFVQTGMASARETLDRTLPDSFIRCGGEAVRNQTLHRMAADGSMLRTLSPHETPEWYTSIDADGRILYARWDYVDRDARISMGLWACNPDGGNPAIVFGNYTRAPYCVFEARPIPDSRRVVFTGSAHHAHTGGPLMVLDPQVDVDGQAPLVNLTPEVSCPESEGFPHTYYQAPWPLSKDFFQQLRFRQWGGSGGASGR